MSNVIQAKCPSCQNTLRIPAEWVSKPMRCKHCKTTFQPKEKASANANVAIAKPAVPVAAPATAVVKAVPVASAPPKKPSGDPFAFNDDEPEPAPSVARRKPKGSGTLLLIGVFFFLFLVGAGAATFVVLKARDPGLGIEPKQIAKGDSKADGVAKTDGNGKKVDGTPKTDGAMADGKRDDAAKTDDGPKKTDGAMSDAALSTKDLIAKADGMPKKDDGPATDSKPKTDDAPKKPADGTKPPPFKDLVKKDTKDGKKDGKKSPFTSDPFPRRALLISVNNYLMFNTVHYGSGRDSFKGGFPGSSTAILRERLAAPPMHFPFKQVVELSDGIPPEIKSVKAHSTQRSVIETTIKDFVDTSREQDRIMLLFAGHAVQLEDKAYLIPIDGNLKNPESLVPLKWVYDQLAKCRAQQKVLVLDVFRFSPGRGFELPSAGEGDEGTMPEAFDKELENPPPGVQVWCSCLKEQSSVELEGGSAFLQALCFAMQGTAELTGFSQPSQPIGIESLVVKVNQKLKELLTPEKRTQVSRLTGKASETIVPPNAVEPTVEITLKPPTAAGGDAAGHAQVNNILDEIKLLPSVRETRQGEKALLSASNLPAFGSKKLDAYKPDGYQNIAELQGRYKKDKEAFAKAFPMRAAVFDAVAALEESNQIRMIEVLNGPVNAKDKPGFLKKQSDPGISIFKLEQALAVLKEAGEKRDVETSKRWLANFDYTQARLQSRLVYLFEYSYTLGQIRADNLPELAPGQSGWRIGTGKKIAVTEAKAKALSKDTKKIWDRIQNQYPDTPWALLAQRESMISLGLVWRPKSD